jgi:3'-5' exoribonuclease
MIEKKRPLSEYNKFDPVKDIFVVKYKKPIAKYATGYMFELRVGDSSKEMNLKYWGSDNQEEVEKVYDSIQPDSVVLVDGVVKEYRGKLEINTSDVRVLKEGEFEKHIFIKKAERDIDEMFKELQGLICEIKNPQLRKVIDSFFADKQFVEKFKNHPGAMYKHHNYIGGLLEHTLHVTKICKMMYDLYPKMNKDLLLAGAILHDIGKIKELDYTNNIFATDEGRLLGHLIQGFDMLSNQIKRLGVEGNIKTKILHMMLAQHGKREYGSPKEPMFPEALCVYLADEMDSRLYQMIDFKEKMITEDNFAYSKSLGSIYLD